MSCIVLGLELHKGKKERKKLAWKLAVFQAVALKVLEGAGGRWRPLGRRTQGIDFLGRLIPPCIVGLREYHMKGI